MSKTTKKKPESTAPAPAKTPAPSPAATAWPADQYTGVGGRYVRDPATGERRPADEQLEKAATPA